MTHRTSARSMRRRTGAAALAAAAVLGVAACSGGPAAGAGEGGDTELTVLHAPINYEALYVAEQEGYFDEEGLDVTITPGGTAQDNLAQLAGGSADLSIVSWDAAVTATAENLPIRLVSNNAVISQDFDTSGVVVRKDSGITSMADLAGKTIAFNSLGSGGNVPVLQALAADGVDAKDVEQVALPYASMQAALEGKQVDAVFPSDSFYAQVTADDDFTVIANPSREYRGGLGITLWAATEPWLAQHADAAEKFNAAMAKAIDFANDPAHADAIYQIRSEVSEQPVEKVKSQLVEFDAAIDPEISQATTDALAEFGIVEGPKPFDDIVWEEAPRG